MFPNEYIIFLVSSSADALCSQFLGQRSSGGGGPLVDDHVPPDGGLCGQLQGPKKRIIFFKPHERGIEQELHVWRNIGAGRNCPLTSNWTN